MSQSQRSDHEMARSTLSFEERDGASAGARGGRAGVPLRAAMWTLVALLVAAAVALPFADPGASGGTGTGARQKIQDALTGSLGERTVQMTFTATVNGAGMTAQVSGTGAADLTSKSAVLHVTGTDAGQHETVSIEMVGGTLYVDAPQIAAAEPGKSWLSLRPGSSTGLGSAFGGLGTLADPGAALPLLRASGAVVTPLGPSTLGGTSVQGYRVSMSAAAIGAAASAAGLPAGAAQQVQSLVVDAYVSGNRLQAIDVTETGNLSVTASIDFHGYGSPVSVEAPAPTTVVPFSQFLGGGALSALSTPA